jgi:hypothetical protein
MCLEKIDVSLVARKCLTLNRSQVFGGKCHLRRMTKKGTAEVKTMMATSNLIAEASR